MIKELEDLANKFGVSKWDIQVASPCYMEFFCGLKELNTHALIKKYIKLCIKEWKSEEERSNQQGWVCFSVTEEEEHHKKWLDVADEEGYFVLQSKTRHYKQSYKCFLLMIPTNPRLTPFI